MQREIACTADTVAFGDNVGCRQRGHQRLVLCGSSASHRSAQSSAARRGALSRAGRPKASTPLLRPPVDCLCPTLRSAPSETASGRPRSAEEDPSNLDHAGPGIPRWPAGPRGPPPDRCGSRSRGRQEGGGPGRHRPRRQRDSLKPHRIPRPGAQAPSRAQRRPQISDRGAAARPAGAASSSTGKAQRSAAPHAPLPLPRRPRPPPRPFLIARASCCACHPQDYKVVVAGRTQDNFAKAVALRPKLRDAAFVACDITDKASVKVRRGTGAKGHG